MRELTYKKEAFEEKLLFIVMVLMLILIPLIVGFVISEAFNSEESIETVVEGAVNSQENNTEEITEKVLHYTISNDERELLAKLVYCEAGICSLECKEAIVSVIFNRLESGHWGDSITDVIEYPNAFTPVLFGVIETAEPDYECYLAVDNVLKNGITVPEYVRYFRAWYGFSSVWGDEGYIEHTEIDDVYFGYFKDWERGQW